jgi:EAL domain-containing protein (putative c-di-GMP-specific phosphodiesterase class I)
MARALKHFADKMDSTIIAEGVETEGELSTLLELGIEYGQGFLLGKPAAGIPAGLEPSAVAPAGVQTAAGQPVAIGRLDGFARPA